MIFGIGTDICDVRRIAAAQLRHGDRFAQRVLGPAELQVWRARGQRWPDRANRYLATRFSDRGFQQGDWPWHAHAHDLAAL